MFSKFYTVRYIRIYIFVYCPELNSNRNIEILFSYKRRYIRIIIIYFVSNNRSRFQKKKQIDNLYRVILFTIKIRFKNFNYRSFRTRTRTCTENGYFFRFPIYSYLIIFCIDENRLTRCFLFLKTKRIKRARKRTRYSFKSCSARTERNDSIYSKHSRRTVFPAHEYRLFRDKRIESNMRRFLFVCFGLLVPGRGEYLTYRRQARTLERSQQILTRHFRSGQCERRC